MAEIVSDGELYFSVFDRWLISRLHLTIKNIDNLLSKFRFDLAAKELYEFVWNEFCDWYLELSKTQLNSKMENRARATRRTMLKVLEKILCISHPFIPFITEELWQKTKLLFELPTKRQNENFDSIMLAKYPEYEQSKIDKLALMQITQLKIISEVRILRSEMSLKPSEKVPLIIIDESDRTQACNNFNLNDNSQNSYDFILAITSLGKLSNLKVLKFVTKDLENLPLSCRWL